VQLDALLPFGGRWTGRPVSVYELPEFCRDTLSQGIQRVNGIAEIERMAAKDDALQLQASMMPDLVAYMNSSGKYEAQIIRLFWSVDPMALAGVVDRVRTALTALVAELVANIPPGAEAPAREGAERRALLEDLGLDTTTWRMPPSFPGPAADVMAASAQHGLEGIVAKRLASTYRPGQRFPGLAQGETPSDAESRHRRVAPRPDYLTVLSWTF
jgi:AbiTii